MYNDNPKAEDKNIDGVAWAKWLEQFNYYTGFDNFPESTGTYDEIEWWNEGWSAQAAAQEKQRQFEEDEYE